jgi:hypothetical protein
MEDWMATLDLDCRQLLQAMDALGRFVKGRALRSNGFIALAVDETDESGRIRHQSHAAWPFAGMRA